MILILRFNGVYIPSSRFVLHRVPDDTDPVQQMAADTVLQRRTQQSNNYVVLLLYMHT